MPHSFLSLTSENLTMLMCPTLLLAQHLLLVPLVSVSRRWRKPDLSFLSFNCHGNCGLTIDCYEHDWFTRHSWEEKL